MGIEIDPRDCEHGFADTQDQKTMYPKTLFKNVLLSDGKIINWEIGTTCWDSVDKAFCSRQPLKLLEELGQLTAQYESCVVHSAEENNAFFQDEAFFRQFPIHEQFPKFMFRPYTGDSK
jgi:hypothetical protein